jgi:hypothetical protein
VKGVAMLVGLVVVGVLIAGMAGVVNIPGLTPQKKTEATKEGQGKGGQSGSPQPQVKKERPKQPVPIVQIKKRAPESDPAKGQDAVAQLWENLSADSLLAIVKDWKDPELAKILLKMDSEKVSALLEKLDSGRASKLTRAIQKEAERLTGTERS